MVNNILIFDEGMLYVVKFSSDIFVGEIDGFGKLLSMGSFVGIGMWILLLRSGFDG